MTFGPPDSWYDPPEPRECCSQADDDPDHDREQCWADSAEAAAEAKAERQREDEMEGGYWDPRPDPRTHPEYWTE